MGITLSAIYGWHDGDSLLQFHGQIHCLLYGLKIDLASDMASDSRKLCRCFKVEPNLGEHSGRAVSCKQCKRPKGMVIVKSKWCLCSKAAQNYDGEASDKAMCYKHCCRIHGLQMTAQ